RAPGRMIRLSPNPIPGRRAGPRPTGVRMSDTIQVQVQDGIQIMTINRPQARNAIDLATAQALAAALEQLDARDDVRLGIITGAGGTFSSGMDLKAFAKSGE